MLRNSIPLLLHIEKTDFACESLFFSQAVRHCRNLEFFIQGFLWEKPQFNCVPQLHFRPADAQKPTPQCIAPDPRFFRARGLLRESLAREADLALETAFSFAGARCDRIVETVMARIAALPKS